MLLMLAACSTAPKKSGPPTKLDIQAAFDRGQYTNALMLCQNAEADEPFLQQMRIKSYLKINEFERARAVAATLSDAGERELSYGRVFAQMRRNNQSLACYMNAAAAGTNSKTIFEYVSHDFQFGTVQVPEYWIRDGTSQRTARLGGAEYNLPEEQFVSVYGSEVSVVYLVFSNPNVSDLLEAWSGVVYADMLEYNNLAGRGVLKNRAEICAGMFARTNAYEINDRSVIVSWMSFHSRKSKTKTLVASAHPVSRKTGAVYRGAVLCVIADGYSEKYDFIRNDVEHFIVSAMSNF